MGAPLNRPARTFRSRASVSVLRTIRVSASPIIEARMDTGSPTKDCSISTWKAQIWSLLLMVPVVFMCVAPYLIIWGHDALDGVLEGIHAGVLISAFIGGIAAYEFLHGIGWALAGQQRWEAVSFGFKLKSLTPYAHLNEPLEAWAYRTGAALPGVTLGLVPRGISLVIGHGPLHIFGVIFIAVASGDAIVLWLLRDVPADAWVQDHPDRVGGILVLQLQLAGITGGVPGSSPVMAFLGLTLMMASPQGPPDHSRRMWDSFPEQPLHQALRFGHS